MTKYKGAIDDELRDGARHASDEHLPERNGRREVAQPSHGQSRRIDHVAKLVHTPTTSTTCHLPKLIRAEWPMAGNVAIVGFVQLREDNRTCRHIHPNGECLGRKYELNKLLLKTKLNELSQDGQHARVVVSDTSEEQSHDLLIGVELSQLRHVALKMLAVHQLKNALTGTYRGSAFLFLPRPSGQQFGFGLFGSLFFMGSHSA
mmetsp:Transcript_19283/g.58165  ORF Transcript_19283/g.58165 Transcript_19283/m.58165 type:complete len:204 (-) Transcript_19283:3063-3674(-)